MAKATPVIGMNLTLNDGSTVTVFEGDIIRGLTHLVNGGLVKIDECAVRVICATTKAQSAGPQGCPPNPYLENYITPTMIVADSSDENLAILDQIKITDIVGLTEVVSADEAAATIIVGPDSYYKSLTEVIDQAPEGAVIKLKAGEYTEPLTLNKDITLIGDKSGGTVLTGAITTGAPLVRTMAANGTSNGIKLVLSDLKLTGDATIVLENGVEEFTMNNCEFGGHNLNTKTMPINVRSNEPLLMKIIGNNFIDQNSNAYNLFELRCDLKDGSVFENNTFSAKCVSHVIISMYGLDNGATVSVANNTAYMSGLIRVGFRGEPNGTLDIRGNTYDEDLSQCEKENLKYYTIFLIEPYDRETISMGKLLINVASNIKPVESPSYGYLWMARDEETLFTQETAPKVTVEGKPFEFPADMQASTVIPIP